MAHIDISSLDQSVQDYIRELRAEAAGYRVKNQELNADLAERDSSLKKSQADLESLTSRAAAAEKSLADRERDTLVRLAAQKHGLPEVLANRLTGTTADELDADAKALAEASGIKSVKTPPKDDSVRVKADRGDREDNPANRLGDALRTHFGLAPEDD